MSFSLKRFVVAAAAFGFVLSPAFAQMSHEGMDHGPAGHDQMDHDRSSHMVEGVGTVVAIDLESGRIGLDHAPVPDLKWPAMRMAFKVGDGVDLTAFQPGDKVQFTLHRVEKGAYPIAELCVRTSDAMVPGLCMPRGEPESSVK